jgi:hypothetical protein
MANDNAAGSASNTPPRTNEFTSPNLYHTVGINDDQPARFFSTWPKPSTPSGTKDLFISSTWRAYSWRWSNSSTRSPKPRFARENRTLTRRNPKSKQASHRVWCSRRPCTQFSLPTSPNPTEQRSRCMQTTLQFLRVRENAAAPKRRRKP